MNALAPWLYEWARNRRRGPGIKNKKRLKTGGEVLIGRAIPPHIASRARGEKIAGNSGIVSALPPFSDIAAALAVIPNHDLGWDDWNRVGMAIWASTDGDTIGREMFDRWSAKSKKYEEGATEERWNKYATSPPNELSFGTLVYLAREAVPGWSPPSTAPNRVDPHRAAALPFDPHNLNGQPGLPPSLTAAALAPNPLIELNEKHSVIADVGGKCLVLSWINSKVDKSVKVPSFQSFTSFRERYQNQYIQVNGDAVPLGKYWLSWTGRQTYEGIDLVPNGEALLPGNVLNLWRGFAVEPLPGDWSLMQSHICKTLAGGNVDLAKYIIKWAAWAVQHPDEPAEVALVLKGGKKTGKSTFGNAMRRLFGQHGMQVYSSRHLTGNFNAHLRSCLLLFADEAFWAGDKQGESTLKAILTEPTIVIEQKGVDATPWTNRLHVIMAANADWVVPASHDERRFQMAELDDEPKGYFPALHQQLKEGGLSAMLYDLLRVDLTGWHPREIVQTDALREQKIQTMGPLEYWWEDLLQSGVLPFHQIGNPRRAWSKNISDAVKEGLGKREDVSGKALGIFLRKIGAEGSHKESGNLWTFPELKLARKQWEKKYNGWIWRDKNIENWQDKLKNKHDPSVFNDPSADPSAVKH